jgi:hypothetical protein
MTNLLSLFDSYSRQARLYPALLALFPISLILASFAPTVFSTGVGATIVTFAISCGLVFLLADIARSAGRRAEAALIDSWGGWPTTHWLRHSSSANPAARARILTYLSENVAGFTPPTLQQESDDQCSADLAYESAVHWLKAKCRGLEYGILLNENATYGFRRNMLGMRKVALLICIVTIIIAEYYLCFVNPPNLSHFGLGSDKLVLGRPEYLTMSAIAIIVAMIGWLYFVTPAWVRNAGDRYAEALFSCCDGLSSNTG